MSVPVPDEAGVPVMRRVLELKLSPAGKPETLYEMLGLPLDAVAAGS